MTNADFEIARRDKPAWRRWGPYLSERAWGTVREDYTGCGNTLDTHRPHGLRLVMDSLRYWVTEMQVDGFRFDLATSLGRQTSEFDPVGGFLDAVGQDPCCPTSS
jgi:pullulanase/glycogen debranching enzyme